MRFKALLPALILCACGASVGPIADLWRRKDADA